MKELFKKRWVFITAIVAITIAIVYAMIYVDVMMRAREAYAEGEKYWLWHFNPEQKKEYLETELKKELGLIERKFSRGKIDKTEYEQEYTLFHFTVLPTQASELFTFTMLDMISFQ